MDSNTAYHIPVFSLKNGKHDYEFLLQDDFFLSFDHHDLKKGKVIVKTEVEKNERVIIIDLFFKGFVELICDRTLEAFDYQIDLEKKLVLKYGDEEKVLDEESIQITSNTQRVDISRDLFEFVVFAIPVKKLHPSLENEDADNEQEGFMIFSSKDVESEEEEKKTQASEQKVDPRWKALKKLKGDTSDEK